MRQSDFHESQATMDLLQKISMGMGLTLWLMLMHTLVWPAAAVISRTMDKPLISYGTFAWAVPIAMVIALLLTRMVFPVTYTSTNDDQNT